MRHFRFVFFLFLVVPVLKAPAQQRQLPDISLTRAEEELRDLINQYRNQKGLQAIPVSKNLTYVAKLHVKDLADNHPYNKRCNLHSWSDEGPWSPCCYTEDHEQAACMWNKPQELSNYPGLGYEIDRNVLDNVTKRVER